MKNDLSATVKDTRNESQSLLRKQITNNSHYRHRLVLIITPNKEQIAFKSDLFNVKV